MAEAGLNSYATTGTNTAATTPNVVAAISDGTGSRQVVVLGAGDGTTTLVDGTAAHPINVSSINGQTADTTGTFTNATQTTSVTATNLDGYANVLISINGTYGTATAVFEGSDDSGTTFYPLVAARDNTNIIELGYTSLTNTNQTWQINNAGFDSIRVRSTAVATGTVNVRLSVSAEPTASAATVGIGTALPAGTNVIGHVISDSGSVTAATLNAETTKVIGVVRTADGSGNLLTSTSNALNVDGAAESATGSTVPADAAYGGLLAQTANPSATTAGQLVGALSDKLGKQVVVGSIRDLKANQVTTITSSTAETTIVTSVSSVFLDMYGIIVTNTSATAVNVAVKDATAGTTRFNIAVPAGDTRGFMLPEGGAIKQSAVTNNWTATVSASVASVIVTALTVQNL